MKNLVALFCVVSAVAAFAEENVSTYTDSGNTFGVLRVDVGVSATNTIIAVPWLEPSTGEASIAITNVIKTANLRENDQLYYYDASQRKYRVWNLNASKRWVAVQTVTDDNKVEAAENQVLVRGNAILLKRPGEREASVYLYGQVAASSTGTVSMARSSSAEVHTLIAPPRASATDINSGEWANVKEGDMLVIDSKVEPYKYNPVEKKWGHKTIAFVPTGIQTNWTYASGVAIPVGQGAWFTSMKAGGEAATWKWTDLPSVGK